MKFKNIVSAAETVKAYVEKHGKLPSTVNGLSKPEYSYILINSVLNPGKDIDKVTYKYAPNPNGNSWNKNLTKKEYTETCNDVIKWTKSNKQLPNYDNFQNKHININLIVYCCSKIIVWYSKNKRLPNTCEFKSSVFNAKSTAKPTSRLKEYLTNKGCAGMGQCTGYYCGPNSLQQCLYRLTGIKVDESTLAKWAGTTTSGTDHQGLETAVAMFNKKYGKKVKITWKNFSDLGNTEAARWKALANYIKKGAVFCHILYRKKWGHYEVPKSIGDSNMTVLNSLGDKCTSSAYCGYIETRTKAEHRNYINGISQKSIAILTI